MLGLFVLAVLIGVGFLIYLGYKVPRKYFNSKIAGFWGALLVFGIFFGDHIYYYIQYRYICATQTKNEIYDEEAYERYEKSFSNGTTERLQEKKLEDFMKKNEIENFKNDFARYDYKNNYLSIKTVNLFNKKVIREFRDYYDGHGGWLCKKLDLTRETCNFQSCSSNKLGKFK